jgi:hypothetical protein
MNNYLDLKLTKLINYYVNLIKSYKNDDVLIKFNIVQIKRNFQKKLLRFNTYILTNEMKNIIYDIITDTQNIYDTKQLMNLALIRGVLLDEFIYFFDNTNQDVKQFYVNKFNSYNNIHATLQYNVNIFQTSLKYYSSFLREYCPHIEDDIKFIIMYLNINQVKTYKELLHEYITFSNFFTISFDIIKNIIKIFIYFCSNNPNEIDLTYIPQGKYKILY